MRSISSFITGVIKTKFKKTAKDGREEDELLRVRTQFLRNMSHRIDTDMIHRLTRSSSKFREISDKMTIPDFVTTVFDVGEEYATMLEHVLKYYDSVSNKFATVDGPILIRNIVSDARTDARRQMLRVSAVPPRINVDIRHDVPISEMIGDGLVIKECLQELIFNGLRHDHNTHVSVRVYAMSHDPHYVTFSVENQGVQIKEEDLRDIFTPFHSVHRGIVHGSGLGIGLARCKRMAMELGGDLLVDNGPVTNFSLTVPLKHEKKIRLEQNGIDIVYERSERADAGVDEESRIFKSQNCPTVATQPSILVVDDSAIARKQFEKMLKYVDIDVDCCDGATKCLEMVKNKTYDVICLDIIMPVMSGITCAHHLREGTTTNKNSPIVIITADSSVETRQLCACIVDSMVLEKPAKRSVLFRTIMASIRDSSKKEWMRKKWHDKVVA